MRDPELEAMHDDLANEGLVAPVDLGGAEEQLWLDCDLASLAENRIGDRTDPRALDETRRTALRAKVTTEAPYALASRSRYERCYWLLEGGARVGTIAVGTMTTGMHDARMASFYVFPTDRSRGTGRRALDRVKAIAARHDLGLRLDTCWSWQRAVRFYLRAGMWLYMWKRDLTFFWNDALPPVEIEVGAEEASLSVSRGGAPVVLARARRKGEQLELDEPERALRDDKSLGEAPWHATSMLSLALALEGWPLIRSAEDWKKRYYADAGAPEALAYKISLWEAWDRDHGWRVETPRIPGLSYPTWPELEAKWARENAEFEAKRRAKEEG
ncbi:MAG: GNAT family N-acetyltransferase [Byssovorax sp.]